MAEELIAGNRWINPHNLFVHGVPYAGINLSKGSTTRYEAVQASRRGRGIEEGRDRKPGDGREEIVIGMGQRIVPGALEAPECVVNDVTILHLVSRMASRRANAQVKDPSDPAAQHEFVHSTMTSTR